MPPICLYHGSVHVDRLGGKKTNKHDTLSVPIQKIERMTGLFGHASRKRGVIRLTLFSIQPSTLLSSSQSRGASLPFAAEASGADKNHPLSKELAAKSSMEGSARAICEAGASNKSRAA